MVTQPSTTRYTFVGLEVFSSEGGIQSYVREMLSAYLAVDEHWQADVFLLRDSADCQHVFQDESRCRFHYFKSPNAQWSRLKLAAELALHCWRDRPQRVISSHLFLAPLLKLICQPLGIPYTVIAHGKEVWQTLEPKRRQALQQANSIWTVSRYSKAKLCESNDVSIDKVHLLPCVVDGERFSPGPRNPQLVNQYGLEGAKVLMTVARLWSGDIYKGVDVTIRALPRILEQHPDVKYLVVGRGDDQPRLAQLAEQLGVSEQVVFAGFVADEALVDHYRLADAYVMPSQEGFGIVYLEAMACEKPVLAGDADGSADPLQDGRLGWPVPHRDSEAVAVAILEMLAGDDQRCDGEWLREEALALFGKAALRRHLAGLLTEEPTPEAELRLARS